MDFVAENRTDVTKTAAAAVAVEAAEAVAAAARGQRWRSCRIEEASVLGVQGHGAPKRACPAQFYQERRKGSHHAAQCKANEAVGEDDVIAVDLIGLLEEDGSPVSSAVEFEASTPLELGEGK